MIQTQDVIFNLRSQSLAYLAQVHIPLEKMELLAVLWAQFRYLFLWEGSPEPDSIGVWRRLLQAVFKVE
ncbi:MAG: hypothetical protein DRQ02_01240 [Candidatus Latescibacterota bacterium]|nr:MAG: hypothetical protein DRQ24_12265 [Candidatus Latescibacterota bacterium]RKY69374.1 MAG: hypothetical protein DRQ02_01240 [Candidatus Latescibacterota bacterium]